ncbi:hypothetical protein [Actinoplanes sp. NPDC051859]|uniref:hypothetical protein n=1 Tax=Actinoplanes sp. NPDC051859 TaxID=3363909 RepID=UPI00379B2B8C
MFLPFPLRLVILFAQFLADQAADASSSHDSLRDLQDALAAGELSAEDAAELEEHLLLQLLPQAGMP